MIYGKEEVEKMMKAVMEEENLSEQDKKIAEGLISTIAKIEEQPDCRFSTQKKTEEALQEIIEEMMKGIVGK